MERASLDLGLDGKNFQTASKKLSSIARWLTSGQRRAFDKILLEEFAGYTNRTLKTLGRRHRTNWPYGTTQNTLSKRSGRLARSLERSARTRAVEGGIESRIRLPHYAGTQEFGATITPKRSQYLTIPLDAALDQRGRPRKKRARQWPNTFIMRSKKGNLLIMQKRQNGSIVPLYVLKKKVVIPPRLGMRKEFDARALGFLSTVAGKLGERFLRDA